MLSQPRERGKLLSGAGTPETDAPRVPACFRRPRLYILQGVMSEHGKCPMGKHPWLATFFVLTFLLVFAAHKLGLL